MVFEYCVSFVSEEIPIELTRCSAGKDSTEARTSIGNALFDALFGLYVCSWLYELEGSPIIIEKTDEAVQLFGNLLEVRHCQ